MNFELTCKPQLDFNLMAEQVSVLLRCSELHYDSLCKSVGKPGNGSFIWGWKNASEWRAEAIARGDETADDHKACRAGLNELDLSLKVLEMSHYLNEQEQLVAKVLRDNFSAAFKKASELTLTWSTLEL